MSKSEMRFLRREIIDSVVRLHEGYTMRNKLQSIKNLVRQYEKFHYFMELKAYA